MFVGQLKNFLSLNKKYLLIACVIAFILTALTPQLYLNTKYWTQNYIRSYFTPVFFELETSDKMSIHNFIELLSFKNINKNEDFKSLNNDVNILKYRYDYFLTYRVKKFAPIQFKSNVNGKVKLTLGKDVHVKSLKVNGEECVDKILNLDNSNLSYTFNAVRGDVYNIDIQAKRFLFKFGISDIYFKAFFLSFIFMYFAVLGILKFWQNILKYLKQHKLEIVLFFTLWITLFLYMKTMLSGVGFMPMSAVYLGSDMGATIHYIFFPSAYRYHIYYFFPFYTLFDILLVLTKQEFISIFLVFSFINTITLFLIYKAINLILPNKKFLNIILTCIYAFSNVVLYYGYVITSYPITALYLSLILYLGLRIFKNKKLTILNVIVLSLVSALTFGVNMINLIPAIIISLVLICRLSKKMWKWYLVLTFSFILFFVFTKSLINYFEPYFGFIKNDVPEWVKVSEHTHFCNQTLYKPLLPVKAKFITKPIWIIFSLMIIFSLIYVYKNKVNKEDKLFFTTLISLLLFNFITHYIWDNIEGFMFAPNHFALWFMIFAYCLKFIELWLAKYDKRLNYKILCSILILFLIIEIPINLSANLYLKANVIKKYPAKVEYGW